jgi:hypothetical protein
MAGDDVYMMEKDVMNQGLWNHGNPSWSREI